MEIRKKILWTLLASFISLTIAVVLSEQGSLGLCRERYAYNYGEIGNVNNPPRIGCLDPVSESVGQPLGIFSIVFVLLSLSILTVPTSFSSLIRFSKYYLPIAAFLVILAPSTDSSVFGFDKEFMSWFLASIFLLTSLILIARKWWQIRKSDSHILNR